MLVQLPKLICCAKFSLGQFYVAKTRSNGKICFRASFGKHNKGFAKRRQNKRMLHQMSKFFNWGPSWCRGVTTRRAHIFYSPLFFCSEQRRFRKHPSSSVQNSAYFVNTPLLLFRTAQIKNVPLLPHFSLLSTGLHVNIPMFLILKSWHRIECCSNCE